MKYFGKKSLSSVMSQILHVCWYVVLVLAIIAVVIGVMALFSKPIGDSIKSEISKGVCDMNYKDKKDWDAFNKMPLVFRFIIVPYFGVVVVLLLKIIKKSQLLFTNFKNDIVFNKSNVLIIAKINKLLIGFSILTFNFSALLVCVLLLMISEIFKSGAALQEELDLTV